MQWVLLQLAAWWDTMTALLIWKKIAAAFGLSFVLTTSGIAACCLRVDGFMFGIQQLVTAPLVFPQVDRYHAHARGTSTTI